MEEEDPDAGFYALLNQQLYNRDGSESEEYHGSPTSASATPFAASTSSGYPEHEDETSTDDFVCTCPWYQQLPPADPEGDHGPTSPTPSDILYDELVHRDYVCKDIQESASGDSRFTPDNPEDGQAHMVPFKVRWSFGFTIKAHLVNFTRGNRKEFFVATAHKGNIYNYATNEMRYVHGHIKPVRASSVDQTGRWLVTGGRGYNNKIIVTDTMICKQLLILDSPPGDIGALLLGMAPDARFFFSVHNSEAPKLKIWKWTYGSYEPDCVLQISDHSVGKPCRIVFHPNDQNFFMVAFEKLLILAHWNEDESVMEDEVRLNAYRKLGSITDCEMAMNRHEVYASTANGYIAIFGNVLYTESIHEHPLNTQKMFVKKIKVTRGCIKTMRCPDNIIVILEERGSLKFFDTNILLLYWIETEVPPIKVLSFSLDSVKATARAKMTLKLAHSQAHFDINHEVFDEEDRVLDYDTLLKQGVRSRSSLLRRPFIIRDFVAACQDGRIFHVDIMKGIYQPYFTIADSPVASLSVSTVKSHLYVAYESGRVTIFDYETLESLITSTVLVGKKRRRRLSTEPEEDIKNCSILVSYFDLHLVVARTNGHLIFMSPTLVPLPNQLYKFATTIDHLAFSENNEFLALCDSGTMNVMRYNNEKWCMFMKFRGHIGPVTDLMFMTHDDNLRLFTIGEDRHLVEYSLNENDTDMPLKNRVEIEKTAIPLCLMEYRCPPDEKKYFLVANSEFKFKLIDTKLMRCRSLTVGPHQGCYVNPVNRIKTLPNSNGKYIIFQNNTHMGVLKSPLDGNPYKHIGILANPQLGSIGICNQGKYVFTYATGEGGILVWNINTDSLDMLHYMGGPELEPYHCLIEGGANGWFFKEIEDLFCYMQILHQEDSYSSQTFGNSIFIQDLPDLIRACGFYPSEYEIEQLVYEVKHKDFDKTGVVRDSINFVDFVRAYLNHRPASGVASDEMEKHFTTLLNGRKEFNPHEFAKKMITYGETFSPESLTTCLVNLMSNEDETYDEDILEELQPITFEYFTKTMLGILQESAYTEAQERAMREAEEADL